MNQDRTNRKLICIETWQKVAMAFVIAFILGGILVWHFVFRQVSIVENNKEESIESTASYSGLAKSALIDLGKTQNLKGSGLNTFIALSRDGRHLVYVANIDGTRRLYHRSIDRLTSRPLSGTEGATDAYFSPDGKWVLYRNSNDSLYKVSLAGNSPQRLVENNPAPRGSFWSEDVIYYTGSDKLFRIPALGGEPERVLIVSEYANWIHGWPYVLPGGKHLLLTVYQGYTNAKNGHTILLSLETGENKLLINNGFNARYVPTGHIVFIRSGSLWAVPFDVERLETIGPEVPVINGVETSGGYGQAVYAFSDDGRLVYLPGVDVLGNDGELLDKQIVWVDRKGNETFLEMPEKDYIGLRLSPDNTQLATTISKQDTRDIWTYDLERGTLNRLTSNNNALSFAWTPDGDRLIFGSESADPVGLSWLKADGTGQPEKLIDASRWLLPNDFSLDRTQLIYTEGPVLGKKSADIYTLSMDEDRKKEILLSEDNNEYMPDISPDGRWIAYMSDKTGNYEIYVRPFPDVDDAKWLISNKGGFIPHWRGDGKELFYLQPNSNWESTSVVAVTIDTENGFQAGKPTVLFTGDYIVGIGNFDVTPDGQRFIMIKPSEKAGAEEIVSQSTNLVVVDNWFEELKRLAPPSN